MIDNIQIVLFFDNNTNFNSNQLAAVLNKKYPILGNAVVLPVNPEDLGMPIIIFNENKDINLTINSISTSIIFGEKNLKDHKDFILEVINIFDSEGVSFKRIGIVITRILPKASLQKLKTTLFKAEDLIESTDFVIAWHNEITLDSTKFNCWERYFIDADSNNLLGVFDINTPMDEKYYITDDFVDKSIAQSIKYVDNKMKK